MIRTGCPARAICAVVSSGLLAAAAAAEDCAPDAGPTHGVLRVIDGDTLVLDDAREVRLIGALAPKPDVLSARDGAWPPAREAQRALEALVADRTVTLRFEGRRHDRYGRVLAQVYIPSREDGSGLVHNGQDGAIWVQDRMIREGHARAYALPGNTDCLRALVAAEASARTARRGLWSRAPYRERNAADVAALLRLSGRFTLVEGRVAEVTRAQRTTYINFGTDWRRDFTASLANAVVDKSDNGGARVSGLSGKTVRVRGWITRRNGPMIVLSTLDEIEVLDPETATADGPLPPAQTETPR